MSDRELRQAEEELRHLRWTADRVVVSPIYGERVWLKECFSERGVRLGITECCFADAPCEWHAALAMSQMAEGGAA